MFWGLNGVRVLDEISATLGDYDISKTVDYFMVHDDDQLPEYVGSVQTIPVGQLLQKDELVLARLTVPAAIGRRENIAPICLPVTPQMRNRLYSRYIMTGWKDYGEDSKVLQRAIFDRINLSKCKAEFSSGAHYANVVKQIAANKIICARNPQNASRFPECNEYLPGSAFQILEKTSNRYLLYGLQTGCVCSSVVQNEFQTNDYDDSECGKRLVQHEPLVKGGYSTHPGNWPWHVALYQRGIVSDSNEFEYACGASIVHRYLILTAAHCVTFTASRRKIPTANLLLKLGRFNLSNEAEEHSEAFDVSETIVHEGFHPTTLENDIAILRVKMPIIYNEFIQPVCIWKRDDGLVLPNIYEELGTVVGWDLTDGNRPATVLNEAHMPIPVCDLKRYVGFIDASRYIDWLYENTPNSRMDDPILGHPNIRLINQGDCGQNKFADEPVEERKPVFKQYPWMAALRHPFAAFNYVPCNGVLLNRNYVLATECVFDPTLDEISATLGDYDISKTVDYFMVHDDDQLPEYVGSVQTIPVGQLLQKDELVLARLTVPAAIGRRENIAPICLPVTPQMRNRLYSRYIMTGWKDYGEDSKVLQRAIFDRINLSKCKAEFSSGAHYANVVKQIAANKIICARNPQNASRFPECNEYLPGSAFQILEKTSNRYLLYGLQTGVSGCDVPERYIAISKYLLWILDNIRG
uniref:Uncharacterized protein n=1 Tax=Anopheles stephensi TaxID=30069 RepID=A0A182YA72_ANOST